MSDTIVDMPKVCQMLDSGWEVTIFKNGLGSYTAVARKAVKSGRHRARFIQKETDDFTPEQALTRLAYKVHGEIL